MRAIEERLRAAWEAFLPAAESAAVRLWDALPDPAVRAVLAAAAAVVALVLPLAGWLTQPDRYSAGYAPAQPVPFSHRLHAGRMAMPCLFCHYGADRSRAAGIPALDVCMGCHRVARTASPAVGRLAAAFDAGAPVAWKRVHALPSHVYFDHRPHVRAGVACQSCHGPVEEMTVLAQASSMRMGFCLDCHRNPGQALPAGSAIVHAPENCNACHR